MIMIHFKKIIIPLLALCTTLACGLFTPTTVQPAATLNALYTAAAETLSVMGTQGAATLVVQPSPTQTLFIATSSPFAFETLTPVSSIQPVAQCDAAVFVADVTYPDGSTIGRSTTFTKIWRIKNTGTCMWTTSYSLVFIEGEKFGSQNIVSMPTSTGPGQTVDIPVGLVTPNKEGRYKGYWMLRNSSGVLFGVGTSGTSSIYVDINVNGYTVTGYDFITNYCDANWRNSEKSLPCPGSNGEERGFVRVRNSPTMEDGKSRGKGLVTYPQMINNGVIIGTFPAVNIKTGDHFESLINCEYDANDCDVIFKLEYQIGNGTIITLGQWREIYEGKYYPINIDLSVLNGQSVKFILSASANGSSHEDYALWVGARINRQSSQPPTATSTITTTPTVTVTASTTPTPSLTATATATFTATDTPTATPTETPTP